VARHMRIIITNISKNVPFLSGRGKHQRRRRFYRQNGGNTISPRVDRLGRFSSFFLRPARRPARHGVLYDATEWRSFSLQKKALCLVLWGVFWSWPWARVIALVIFTSPAGPYMYSKFPYWTAIQNNTHNCAFPNIRFPPPHNGTHQQRRAHHHHHRPSEDLHSLT
jgi:hypothetical protein